MLRGVQHGLCGLEETTTEQAEPALEQRRARPSAECGVAFTVDAAAAATATTTHERVHYCSNFVCCEFPKHQTARYSGTGSVQLAIVS